jgi:hypothetical protein
VSAACVASPIAAFLSPSNPDNLHWEMQQVQLAIARRACELFETRGGEHGYDVRAVSIKPNGNGLNGIGLHGVWGSSSVLELDLFEVNSVREPA